MRNVLITGAGIGIGHACARGFGAAGDHVVVTDVLRAEGEATAAAIRAAGGSAEFQPLDVRDSARANELVAAVEAARGPLDVIVANAGIAHTIPLATMSDALWGHTLDVDLTGMVRVVRAAAPRMRAAKRGAIVCISSIVGHLLGWKDHVPYSAAKGGVAGLVRGLAIELAADGIRVNGIAPGPIEDTEGMKRLLMPELKDKLTKRIPLQRFGKIKDIENAALFLTSDAASYINGVTLVVDGGQWLLGTSLG